MISAVDILSFDTQYQAHLPTPADVSGPPFSDYLNRAEETRQSAQFSSGPEVMENSRTSESVSSVNASDGEQHAISGENLEKTASAEKDTSEVSSATVKQTKSDGPDKREKSSGNAQENSRNEGSETDGTAGRNAVKNKLSKNSADSASGVSLKNLKTDHNLITDELSAGEKKTDAVKAEAADSVLSPDSVKSENELFQSENVSASGASADASSQWMKTGKSDEAVSDGKTTALAADIISDARQKGADKQKAAQAKGPEIKVVDLREKKTSSLKDAVVRMRNGQARQEGAESKESGSIPLRSEGDSSFRDQVLVIGTDSSREDSSTLKNFDTTSRAAGELSRALRDGGNSEILKKAQFMLKDQDQGEIKLILKPEKLGEVRIRLNLNDKHIGGRIIVENSSVREVFQENMEQLNRTFREHGFQTAGLEVSVGGRDGRNAGQQGRDSSQVSSRRVSEVFDEQVPRIDSDIFSDSRVNVYI